MWSYYGAKNRLARFYPKPLFNKIIEPFAGAAYYSLRYFENEVLLIDKSPDIISIWEYLQACSIKDINSIYPVKAGQRIKEEDYDCQGQFRLMRYLIHQGSHHGSTLVSSWGAARFQSNLNRIKKNLFKIKHWKFLLGDYTASPSVKATYFIDSPYESGGHKYPYSNKKIDFNHLSVWAASRKGQVIVCENTKASWLPFVPLKSSRGVQFTTTEAIWTNMPTSIGVKQMEMF